jgi:hypothetical protein
VIPVYVAATAQGTETRLLNAMRRSCLSLPQKAGLLSTFQKNKRIPEGKKVVIVLDQFEQWIHAKPDAEDSELLQALRECDGELVQCVLMVRDDFWTPVSRFLKQLEVQQQEGKNMQMVDLFDQLHAKKVLTKFGQAFGALGNDLSKDQDAFLDQAVSGLAQDGKVISVRLALFAEMVKGKPWNSATLKEVDGTEGVGVTFLNETFTAPTAPVRHRLHQKAAQAVLKALLPDIGTDIKGNVRSDAEMLEASGYSNRSKDFDELVRLLDGELRLVTPTDPEGHEEDSSTQVQAGAKYYQLTHDYLVPSLRDWLSQEQKKKKQGRAELLLSDRAVVWNAFPENRQLPSLLQWWQVRWLTQQKNWTPPQRKMMNKATRYHAVRGIVVGIVLVVATITGLVIQDYLLERDRANVAEVLVKRLFDANIDRVLARDHQRDGAAQNQG